MGLTLAQRSQVSALRAMARGLRVPPWLSPATWAAERRRLSAKSSAMPGKWDPSRIPFLNAIMDALGSRHPARLVTFCKSAQTGGSECGLNWIGQVIDVEPGPMLVLMPTEKLGLRWVRGRLRPMVLESPTLNRKLRLGRQSKSSGGTLTELHFPGGVIYLGSANVPSDLSSVPVQRLLLDEVDRMARIIEGEGNPIELAKRRVAAYQGRSKCFQVSTPTDDASPIANDYAASSRGRYYVPCPHCEAMQVLRWENLKYTPDDPSDARMACVECGVLIDEAFKGQMLERGEWRHERPDLVGEHIGFHVNGLYTPSGLGDSWADNARAYEVARDDPAKRQVFRNTRLGEIDLGGKVRVDWEEMSKRAEPYALRTIPSGIFALTAGVDVQQDRVEAQIVGWGRGERAAVIDYRIIEGDVTDEETWKALDDYLAAPIANEYGVEMRISCALVDAGNWQKSVLDFTRPLRGRSIFASRGSHILARQPIGRPSFPDTRKLRGKDVPDDRLGARLYTLGVSELKKVLYARLRADGGHGESPTTPATRFVRFPAGLPDEYFRQLVAEEFNPDKRKWLPLRERNEALDTMIYAMAAAMHEATFGGVHRWREADYARLKQLCERSENPTPGTAPDAVSIFDKWSRQ